MPPARDCDPGYREACQDPARDQQRPELSVRTGRLVGDLAAGHAQAAYERGPVGVVAGLVASLAQPSTAPTSFVYDGHPGGAGFAERAHAAAWQWLSATRDVIAQCPCETGCPSCVQSPKCGNGNQPLAKTDAVRALAVVLSALAHDPG
ncbi:MAG: DUF1998 domain-containing protein [Micromonosporaceae bacterium]|nr:DUF1998 domain-containing protein [Micromonosporaceae bacterium]